MRLSRLGHAPVAVPLYNTLITRLQCEALRSTWLVGMSTKAVVREHVRLTWVEL